MPGVSVYLSKKNHVKAALLRSILAGELAPGTFLRQNDLATQFGLSSTPVREALSELQASGLLQHQQHRGFRVALCDEVRVRQVYEARRIVEPQVARLALPRLERTSVQAMGDHLAAMKRHWQDGQHTEMAAANNAFHLALFVCSDNPFLVETVERLWHSLPRFVPWQAPGRMAPSLAEHQDILTAAQRGDGTQLVQAYETHLENALAVFLQQLAAANANQPPEPAVAVPG